METLHWGLSAPFGGLHCTRVTFHKFRKCHFWELSTGAGGGGARGSPESHLSVRLWCAWKEVWEAGGMQGP